MAAIGGIEGHAALNSGKRGTACGRAEEGWRDERGNQKEREHKESMRNKINGEWWTKTTYQSSQETGIRFI